MDASEYIELGGDDGFRLLCFGTRHIEVKGSGKKFKEQTFGCQFELGKGIETRRLVYTSDTRYFSEMVSCIDMPDVLIANISGVYEDDFMLVKPKERHLGYYGCYFLLKDIWKRFSRLPELVMLSEFWNGENDIRYDVSAFLEKHVRQECSDDRLRVVPAEVGMNFRVTDGAVRCTQCGKFSRQFLIYRPSGYEEKIKILCSSCVY